VALIQMVYDRAVRRLFVNSVVNLPTSILRQVNPVDATVFYFTWPSHLYVHRVSRVHDWVKSCIKVWNKRHVAHDMSNYRVIQKSLNAAMS